MTATDEARKALIDMGCSCDVMHGYQCGLHGALTAYETIRDAEKREAGRREGLEEVATQHYRCKKCGECRCQHPESARQLEDTNVSIAEYQAHVRALATPASSSDASQQQDSNAGFSLSQPCMRQEEQPSSGQPAPSLEASGAQGTSAYAEFDKAVKFLQENGYGDWDGTANGQETTLTGCANMMRQYLSALLAKLTALRERIVKDELFADEVGTELDAILRDFD